MSVCGCRRNARVRVPVTQSSTSTARASCSQLKPPIPYLNHYNFIHDTSRICSRRLRPLTGISGLYSPPGQLSQVSPNGPAVRQKIAQRVQVMGEGEIDPLEYQSRLQRPFRGLLRVPADVTRGRRAGRQQPSGGIEVLGCEAQPALGLLHDEFSVVHTRPSPRAAPHAERCRRRCRGARQADDLRPTLYRRLPLVSERCMKESL